MFPFSACFHLSPSSFPSLWNLSVSLALMLSSVMMLTGSNAFRGLEGEGLSDFGVWLTSGEKCEEENTLTFLIFLQHLFLSVTHTVCAAHKSVVLLYIHLVQCVLFLVFSTLEAVVGFSLVSSLFLFFHSHHVILSLSHRYLAVCESSQDFRSVRWVWTSLGEMGHWLGPFFMSSKHVHN